MDELEVCFRLSASNRAGGLNSETVQRRGSRSLKQSSKERECS